MISVIDMPPPQESVWWRGKRGFQVGFFPYECVQVIGDKVGYNNYRIILYVYIAEKKKLTIIF